MGNYMPFPMNFGNADNNIESLEQNSGNYRYPPKSGAYFTNYFVMAGEKFDNMNTETFLFGENNDLNYLSSKPVPFPYHSPNENEPSNTIRCMVHLRKDSLKLVREKQDADPESETPDIYHVEFTFDAEINCAVRVFMMAREDTTTGIAEYTSRKPELQAEPVFFDKGPGQVFADASFKITPGEFQPAELSYIPGSCEVPFVIQITAEDPEYSGHSESTLAGIEKLSDGSYSIKFMKQKIMVDGFSLMLQELYGIENKNKDKPDEEDDVDDDTTECVVCMSSLRDTVMLPCRHLCLCSTCAQQMRNKQSRCPICRANFYALLQIKGVKKKTQNGPSSSNDEFDYVPLIEALNGNFNGTGAPGFKRRTSSARSNRSRKSLKARFQNALSPSAPSASSPNPPLNQDSLENASCELKETPSPEKRSISPEPAVPEPKRTSSPLVATSEREPTVVIDPSKLLRDTSIDESPSNEGSEGSNHLDASLPGTPMDNESYDLNSSHNSSVLFNNSKGSLVIATRAQVTTPSNVNIVPSTPAGIAEERL